MCISRSFYKFHDGLKLQDLVDERDLLSQKALSFTKLINSAMVYCKKEDKRFKPSSKGRVFSTSAHTFLITMVLTTVFQNLLELLYSNQSKDSTKE